LVVGGNGRKKTLSVSTGTIGDEAYDAELSDIWSHLESGRDDPQRSQDRRLLCHTWDAHGRLLCGTQFGELVAFACAAGGLTTPARAPEHGFGARSRIMSATRSTASRSDAACSTGADNGKPTSSQSQGQNRPSGHKCNASNKDMLPVPSESPIGPLVWENDVDFVARRLFDTGTSVAIRSILVSKGHIIIGTEDGRIHWLSAGNLRFAWSKLLSSAPVVEMSFSPSFKQLICLDSSGAMHLVNPVVQGAGWAASVRVHSSNLALFSPAFDARVGSVLDRPVEVSQDTDAMQQPNMTSRASTADKVGTG